MILAVESSCDESALALLDPSRGLVGEWISSQVSLHAEYGGVVPDLASREHLSNFEPLLAEVRREFDFSVIEEIVVTAGPGLAGCLAMGVSVAQSLGVALNKPVFGGNHLRSHAHSPFIPVFEEAPQSFDETVKALLPHLSLVVSGGNTLLARIDEDRNLSILGQTIDDAAGEALDKGAKLLGLGYPGGPKLEQLALGGDSAAYDFPRAMLAKPNLDFSFSGLKTSLRYLLDKLSDDEIASRASDICASYQRAVVDALIKKSEKALSSGDCKSIGLSGGVSNNQLLRDQFGALANRKGAKCLLAKKRHTGDNAGMIAFSHLFEKARLSGNGLSIRPSLTIEQRV